MTKPKFQHIFLLINVASSTYYSSPSNFNTYNNQDINLSLLQNQDSPLDLTIKHSHDRNLPWLEHESHDASLLESQDSPLDLTTKHLHDRNFSRLEHESHSDNSTDFNPQSKTPEKSLTAEASCSTRIDNFAGSSNLSFPNNLPNTSFNLNTSCTENMAYIDKEPAKMNKKVPDQILNPNLKHTRFVHSLCNDSSTIQ